MVYLSTLLISNPQIESFAELLPAIQEFAKGEFHLKIDIKPNYADTPADWEDRIEGAFSGVYSMMGAPNIKTENDY